MVETRSPLCLLGDTFPGGTAVAGTPDVGEGASRCKPTEHQQDLSGATFATASSGCRHRDQTRGSPRGPWPAFRDRVPTRTAILGAPHVIEQHLATGDAAEDEHRGRRGLAACAHQRRATGPCSLRPRCCLEDLLPSAAAIAGSPNVVQRLVRCPVAAKQKHGSPGQGSEAATGSLGKGSRFGEFLPADALILGAPDIVQFLARTAHASQQQHFFG
mmetsp:Transcript_74624/g.189395  ORF Transcript_74624/g.189395 Transcript_74624/m.189395 type:complete len:216 (-) Transcript_74624:290-937(-)